MRGLYGVVDLGRKVFRSCPKQQCLLHRCGQREAPEGWRPAKDTVPDDRAPDWLHHPTLTGLEHAAFTELPAAVVQYLLDHPPISPHHKRARHRTLRRGPLSLSDRLLVTVIRHRWKTQIRVLTALLGSPAAAVGDALHEITPILEALDRRVRPAPITAPTAKDTANLIGKTGTKPQSY